MTVFASIADYMEEARRKVPRPFFEYVENGAYMQETLHANRADLARITLRQRMLDNPSERKLTTTMVEQPVTMPVALAPVGLCGANHARGEILAARAAKDFGVPFCLSTFSIAAIEDVAEEVGGDFWFQLYPMKEAHVNESLLSRARNAGVQVLVVTIDSQVEGTRYRDLHNGLGVPPQLTPGNVWSIGTHPAWALEMLNSPHFTFGNMIGEASTENLSDLSKWVKGALRPAIDGDFLRAIRKQWPGKLVIKGVFSEYDAKVAIDIGADAIVVSNHGGRSLDGAASSAAMLPRLRAVIPGQVEVYVDGGIRTGVDVMRMLGLGARACLIGRPYVYGLGAAGQHGVTGVLGIIRDDLNRVMRMTGVADLAEVPPSVIDAASDTAAQGVRP
jgi:L-lactate dehydrogenase (cytochrome)